MEVHLPTDLLGKTLSWLDLTPDDLRSSESDLLHKHFVVSPLYIRQTSSQGIVLLEDPKKRCVPSLVMQAIQHYWASVMSSGHFHTNIKV